MTSTLELRGLTISEAGRLLVELNLTLRGGEVVTIMAPSGAGKSTALAAITGTLARGLTATGCILLNGKDITDLPTHRRGIGLLFQDPVLFPHLSVGANLAFALPRTVKGRAARQACVDDALASAGMDGFADRDPATLSGGQKARVALLRTLLAEPKALLLDEPFGRLDSALRSQIRSFTFEKARATGLPTLLVTHDPEDARAAGGRVIDTFGNPLPL